MRNKIVSVVTVVAALGALTCVADAAPRRRVVAKAPPPTALTVYKRSYLEPSNQVAVGTYNDYVQESTTLGAAFAVRDLLHNDQLTGESNLPTRYFAPGWTGPQFFPVDFGYRTGRGY